MKTKDNGPRCLVGNGMGIATAFCHECDQHIEMNLMKPVQLCCIFVITPFSVCSQVAASISSFLSSS
jgi:hypothetical protein